jgi:hypothetical protein
VLQVLYYCPGCGSVNEITWPHDLRGLACRDCRQVNDASESRLEVTVGREEDDLPEGGENSDK